MAQGKDAGKTRMNVQSNEGLQGTKCTNDDQGWGKTLVVVTGSNRGFGRTLCAAFWEKLLSPQCAAGSTILLHARKAEDLLAVKDELMAQIGDKKEAEPAHRILTLAADMNNWEPDIIKTNLEECLRGVTFDRLVVVHNAATLGDVRRRASSFTLAEAEEYFRINVSSLIAFNTILFDTVKRKTTIVVNVSSLAAVQAFPSQSLYCSGKAARDMFFSCLALEHPEHVRVLNYAPGPLRTDMLLALRETSFDTGLRTVLADSNILTCEQSAERLIQILFDDNFQSGTHIDYYDL